MEKIDSWVPIDQFHKLSAFHYAILSMRTVACSKDKALDRGGLDGALLTDLSNSSESIKHDLVRTKFAAHGFDSHSLSFIFSYLNERKQRTKIHNSYSPYVHIACGVLQGPILGFLLFNIKICDKFFEK